MKDSGQVKAGTEAERARLVTYVEKLMKGGIQRFILMKDKRPPVRRLF